MEKIETGIYQLPDGRLYVHATATDPYTRQIVHRRETLDDGADLDEARARRKELAAEVRNKRAVSLDARTVEDYARKWIVRKATPPRPLKPTTVEAYIVALERFLDYCGGLELHTLTRPDVIGYRDHLQTLRRDDGKPYASSSLGAWWRPVVTMLRDAVADGYIDKDPTYRIDGPETSRKRTREQRTLSGAELWALVDAARSICPDRAAEITTLAYTGMRSGELWALQWRDIDFAAPRIHIRRSVSLDRVMTGTKTGSERDVYMPDVVGFALVEWLNGRDVRPTDLVFPGPDGRARQRGSIKKSLRNAAGAAGIEQDVTPQVLRRTYNTLMVAAGVDRIVLRAQIGHSDEAMTERYAGVPLAEKRRASLRLVRGGE